MAAGRIEKMLACSEKCAAPSIKGASFIYISLNTCQKLPRTCEGSFVGAWLRVSVRDDGLNERFDNNKDLSDGETGIDDDLSDGEIQIPTST